MEVKKSVLCNSCGRMYEADLMVDRVVCSNCNTAMSRIEQVGHLLDQWYYPRRWLKDIQQPRVMYLIERLWSQQMEPAQLYQTLAPETTNYEVFCFTVTRVVARGIQDGWAELDIPENPLADDPVYRLRILDQERFASQIEAALPDVKWDEQLDVPVNPAEGVQATDVAQEKK